jgi:glutamate synthase (NADPH/NADH) large chain
MIRSQNNGTQSPAPEWAPAHIPLNQDACGVGAAICLGRSQSHALLAHALAALGRMGHRGGALGHELSDGAGILVDAPWPLLQKRAYAHIDSHDPVRVADDASNLLQAKEEWLAINPKFDWPHTTQARPPLLLFFFLDAEQALAQRQTGWLLGCISDLLEPNTGAAKSAQPSSIDLPFQIDRIRRGSTTIGFVRRVPLHRDRLPTQSRDAAPTPVQIGVSLPEGVNESVFCSRLRLELITAKSTATLGSLHKPQTIDLVSASSRVAVYKALCQGKELSHVYPDLQSPDFTASFCLFHERFATNTEPQWHLIQPFENLAHNGEINTIRGQAHRQCAEWAAITGQPQHKIAHQPLSDSYLLSHHLHTLTASGLDIDLAVRAAVGAAHSGEDSGSRLFAQALKALSFPWDGPAALLFTDGKRVGAALDRNGLRPLRYVRAEPTKPGESPRLFICSEAGAFEQTLSEAADGNKNWQLGRLGPGEMLVVDLTRQEVWFPDHVRQIHQDILTSERGTAAIIEIQKAVSPAQVGNAIDLPPPPPLSNEFIKEYLLPTAQSGGEPVSSMGFDASLAPLSPFPVPFSHYFRIRFAQVTNPPIDSIRESLALDLSSTLTSFVLSESPQTLVLKSPIVSRDDRDRICALLGEPLRIKSWLPLSARDTDSQTRWFSQRIAEITAAAESPHRTDPPIWRWILIEDDTCPDDCYPIPSLLVCAFVRQVTCQLEALLSEQRKRNTNHATGTPCLPTSGTIPIGLSCADILTSHDATCALSLGADFVHPWAGESWVTGRNLRPSNYLKALELGLKKNMGRMGISVFDSYKHSMNIDTFGLSRAFCEQFLHGLPGRYGNIGLHEVLREARERHQLDRNKEDKPALFGIQTESWKNAPAFWKWRAQGLYRHVNTPDLLIHLRKAVTLNSEIDFLSYADTAHRNGRQAGLLRSFLDITAAGSALPDDAIEPVESIYQRFSIGAMSVGSISPDAHETLAIGANRIGVRSNSGEGGEDESRYEWGVVPPHKRSRIKQVASGRFGVTLDYLLSADEIQIKIAQGAKPGEGGQLPGSKVNAYIAGLRHTEPGVSLISPPPHHDIYSIEDLKQLIHDLKSANPQALISVKLTSAWGVGRIAVGVAKAGADLIGISGHDGGTGAAPALSVFHVGEPWEIGLIEAHQNLTKAGLRHHVRLWVDGQLRTGKDVVIATLLGADEFSFSTGALLSLGCVLMRKCHENACPAGIATQDPELRKRFTGQPEAVTRYFRFIAEDTRRWLSKIGFRSLGEIRGRKDLLTFAGPAPSEHWKLRELDVRTFLFSQMPEGSKAPVGQRLLTEPGLAEKQIIQDFTARYCPEPGSGSRSLMTSGFQPPALRKGTRNHVHQLQPLQESWAVALQNTDLSFGTRLGSIYRRVQLDHQAKPPVLAIHCKGFAGQSLGAFLPPGITIHLTGAANDGVGKGLCGGHISVSPPHTRSQSAHGIHALHTSPKGLAAHQFEPVLCGNSALYGATAGELFVAGRAGERFAVRNSGARAVVEGAGDHACEYMTGGMVVILGLHGRNMGAGMTGGKTCVIPWRADGSIGPREKDTLLDRQSRDVKRQKRLSCEDAAEVESLIQAHVLATNSGVGRAVLANLRTALQDAWLVLPSEANVNSPHSGVPALGLSANHVQSRDAIPNYKAQESTAALEGP